VAERITACLIVQDEQERLPAALRSVSFCEEIVVVDGGSSDRTVELARAAGAKVIENAWPGFGAQRNLALDAASGEWVLEIDADERVSPRLRESIRALLEKPPPGVGMAVCPLRNRFLGGMLGPSAKYPAYRSRVFRRGAYRHDETRSVHEGIEPRERPLLLEGDLEHELAGTLREALHDVWRYARLERSHLAPPGGARPYAVGILARPLAKLAYRLLVDGGWRDGWRGLLKIWLDAASDALVWSLLLTDALRGSRTARGGAEERAPMLPATHDRHFGRRPDGPAKVVALAAGRRSCELAMRRLAKLRAQGLDVALICDAPPQGWQDSGIAVRPVPRMSPLQAMRALDLEMQIRTIHGVLAVGGRAQLVHSLLPLGLRPRLDPETPGAHHPAA
jgi:hypothetical protein